MDIRISSLNRGLPQGDFAATFRDGVLFVPARLSRFLRSLEIETAEDFVSYLQAYPSAFERGLRWRGTHVAEARRKLFSLLAPVMHLDHDASESRSPSRPLGARLISQS